MDESESNVASQAIVLTIRPSSGATFTVAISTDSTVLALKEKLATADLPAASIRLVYSGRVLKDEDQLSVYSIKEGHTVHMVKSATNRANEQAVQTARPGSKTATAAQGPGAGGMMDGFGDDSGMLNALLDNPAIRDMMANPELVRRMMMSNPQTREVMENNPEVAQMLNDPSFLRQSLDMARNPKLMKQALRNNDRALSNLEMIPGGFNHLRRMYHSVQEPMEASRNAPDPSTDDVNERFAARLNADTRPQAGSINNTALPNPWARPARPAPQPSAFPGFPGMGMPEMPGMQGSGAARNRGFNPYSFGGNPFGGNPFGGNPFGASPFGTNPFAAMENSLPGGTAATRPPTGSAPAAAEAAGAASTGAATGADATSTSQPAISGSGTASQVPPHPFAAMMNQQLGGAAGGAGGAQASNPFGFPGMGMGMGDGGFPPMGNNPEMFQQMMQFNQMMRQMQQHQLHSDPTSSTAASTVTPSSQLPGPGVMGFPRMFGGFPPSSGAILPTASATTADAGAGAGAATAVAPTQPPEVRFETQLTSLRDMGFSDQTKNLRALLASGGDVNSAIEFLLRM